MKAGKSEPPVDQFIIEKIKSDLNELDREWIEIEGKQLKPSQCYRIGVNPLHVLFNTNCPEDLKQKVQTILFKYLPDETESPG